MNIGGEVAVGILLLIFALPFLFGRLNEAGHLKMPRRKSSSAFRQYPTFPVDGEE